MDAFIIMKLNPVLQILYNNYFWILDITWIISPDTRIIMTM